MVLGSTEEECFGFVKQQGE